MGTLVGLEQRRKILGEGRKKRRTWKRIAIAMTTGMMGVIMMMVGMIMRKMTRTGMMKIGAFLYHFFQTWKMHLDPEAGLRKKWRTRIPMTVKRMTRQTDLGKMSRRLKRLGTMMKTMMMMETVEEKLLRIVVLPSVKMSCQKQN